MKLVFHGAAREVGRSCIELQTEGERYLFDAGIKFKEAGFDYPENVLNLPDIDALFISHAHLDHSGALPLFEHNNIICPVYCTKLTFALTKILLKDSYKIARIKHIHEAYDKIDLKKVDKSVRFIKFDQPYKHLSLKFVFKNAGHIPGSAMTEILAEGKKLVYTGDMKIGPTELMKGAFTEFKDVDILITECTYGSRILPERDKLKQQFLDKVEETVNNGGSVLIPVFSLGRAQDILMILGQRKYSCPIYYDGLCNKISKKILGIRDPYVNTEKLEEMTFHKAIHINGEKKRIVALKKQGIFVTTSGMLQGGPVLSYLKELWHEPKNCVLLTGFQCKRTNGRTLFEEGFVYLDGWKTYVKCHVEKFDFSGHSDQNDLKNFIKKVNPKVLILQHGDNQEIDTMKAWAESEIKCTVYAPKVGDEIDLS